MKKFYLISLALAATFFTSCKDDESKGGEKPKTPEDNKIAIQNSAIDMVGQFSELEATPAVQASISLGFIIDNFDGADEGARIATQDRISGISYLNKSIIGFADTKLSMSGFANQPTKLSAEEEESIQSLFDDNKGVYEWNASTEDWDLTTAGGSVIQLKFPADKDGTTNNAVLTLKSYTGTTIANPIDEDYSGDLPESLSMDLTIDGSVEMEYSFDIDYNSNGEPEKVETSLLLNPFKLSYSATNTTSKIGTSASLTNGKVTVIGVGYEINGNFSETAINAAEDEEDIFKDVITAASFEYTMMNLEISGEIDLPNFYDAVADIDIYEEADKFDGESLTAEQTSKVEAGATALEAALNSNTTLTMKYVDSGAKAADIEWKTYTETYSNDWWEEIYVEIGANMVFADESKVDLEDYMTTGFEQLEASINQLLDQFGASVDEDIDHVDL